MCLLNMNSIHMYIFTYLEPHVYYLNLWIFSGHAPSFKNDISKVQDFGSFELSPMNT